MALIAAGGMDHTMYGELDDYDCPRGGGGGARRGSVERSTRASEISLNLDDLQLGNVSPITSTKRASSSTAATTAASSTSSAFPMTRSANSSLSQWQESAAEEQRQRSTGLGESMYDGDDEKTTTNGSRSSLYDSYFWNEGGGTITQFPSLDSVLEDLSGHGSGIDDDGDRAKPKVNAAASSSSSSFMMDEHLRDNLACNYPNATTPHNSHVDCRLSASLSTGNTSSTSNFFSQSRTTTAGGGCGSAYNQHQHGATTRHVHFEVPARLEAIQEFQTPDHEDYPRLYYMAHEIQKMMDDFRGEDQRNRTILR